jgi:hypothetical protein
MQIYMTNTATNNDTQTAFLIRLPYSINSYTHFYLCVGGVNLEDSSFEKGKMCVLESFYVKELQI